MHIIMGTHIIIQNWSQIKKNNVIYEKFYLS